MAGGWVCYMYIHAACILTATYGAQRQTGGHNKRPLCTTLQPVSRIRATKTFSASENLLHSFVRCTPSPDEAPTALHSRKPDNSPHCRHKPGHYVDHVNADERSQQSRELMSFSFSAVPYFHVPRLRGQRTFSNQVWKYIAVISSIHDCSAAIATAVLPPIPSE